jgi:transposase-like protein
MKHHTEDYKETAVKYYLDHNEDMRDTCKIFRCKFQSLARWIHTYKKNKTLHRKTRKNSTPNARGFKSSNVYNNIYIIIYYKRL